MDPKVIEMNNLRVLNDYLNQTLDVLGRGQRFGNGHTPGAGYTPFGGSPFGGSPFGGASFGGSPFGGASFGGSSFGGSPFGGSPFGGSPFGGAGTPAPGGIGTDVVYGANAYGTAYPQMFGGFPSSTFGGHTPFGGGYGPYGAWQQPWGQASWTAGQTPWAAGQTSWPAEAARQAQFTHALAAKQSVLEAMCRMAGIPV